ncbi:amidohydrolase [Arenicella chitinivorans]|uniref:Amidohydrolase n=1 Tax=Arenicella chitinivorans TaxID=1329800 RepID=A0A918VNH3_9GAMM|nr:amidohydrolase family protein [Arenicella chitinivorans]GHA12507.1 amidohydrolase [Arenicella chitinivorans]
MKYLFVKRSLFTLASLLSALVLLLCGAIWAGQAGPSRDLPPVINGTALAIDNVSIVNVRTLTVKPDQQLRLRDGHIEAILPAGSTVPAGYQRVEGNHAYVTPGLMDMHTHIYDRKDLVITLAHGVTTVRNLRGMPMHLRWRQELENKQWLGARMLTSSPVFDRPELAHALQQAVRNPEQARDLVRHFKAEGYDSLKLYNDLEPAVFEAILDEAAKRAIPVVKHGPYAVVSDTLSGLKLEKLNGVQSVEHVEDIFQTVLNFEFGLEKLDAYLRQLANTDVYLTPTLATFDHLTQLSVHKEAFVEQLPLDQFNPFFRTLNEHFAIERWLTASQKLADWNLRERELLLRIAKRAADLQVKLLVGSDQGTMYMPAGSSTHHEMALMQEAGIAAGQVLQAATINAATALQLSHELGTVDVGKRADLVLLANNPLLDVEHFRQPVAVVKSGQWLNRAQLAKLIHTSPPPQHWFPSFGRFLEDQLSRAFL